MGNGSAFTVGDRVWLKNANGHPITTGSTHSSLREVVFTVKAVNDFGYGERYELDTYNSAARHRYCGGTGYSADALMPAEDGR